MADEKEGIEEEGREVSLKNVWNDSVNLREKGN